MTWLHPITSPTCSSWCGCHGNDRCLAMAHWTLSRYGHLKAERMNQFWWNFVHKSILGPQWQSRDQMLKFVKFKMADGRHVRKYWKCHNSPINRPIWTKFGWSHFITSPTCPPWWAAMEAERVNQFRWNLVHKSMLGPQWQSRDQILKFLKFKMADGRHVRKYWKYHNSPSNGTIGAVSGNGIITINLLLHAFPAVR